MTKSIYRSVLRSVVRSFYDCSSYAICDTMYVWWGIPPPILSFMYMVQHIHNRWIIGILSVCLHWRYFEWTVGIQKSWYSSTLNVLLPLSCALSLYVHFIHANCAKNTLVRWSTEFACLLPKYIYKYADSLLFITQRKTNPHTSCRYRLDPCGKREIMYLSTLLNYTMCTHTFTWGYVHTQYHISIRLECICVYSFFCLLSSLNPPSFTYNRSKQRFCNACISAV